MNSKNWLIGFFSLSLFFIAIITGFVVYIDPFFHYHKPIENFYYTLNNQRSQNDGITKHFDYNAIITGTSMTENFMASEVDEIFNVNSIKVPYSGATYKEIDNNLQTAFNTHENIEMVIRSIDSNYFFYNKDEMREDSGTFPDYLYNKNPLDDVYYIFNRDIIYNRCLPIINDYWDGVSGGITSFDNYSYWMHLYTFGNTEVLKETSEFSKPQSEESLTLEEKTAITESIEQNIVSLARENPDTKFYYFFTSYSAAAWGERLRKGTLNKQIDAEQCVIETIIDCENIYLYSFNNFTDITTNLNNYKDAYHYGEWINSYMLTAMKNGEGLLTKENYILYLEQERNFYNNFDYNSLFQQIDEPDRPTKLQF